MSPITAGAVGPEDARATDFDNNTGVLSTNEAPDSEFGGSATLTVESAPVEPAMIAPTITKVFTPSVVAVGEVSTIVFTLTNPNAVELTGAIFTDVYPATMVNATPLKVGGTCLNMQHGAVAGGDRFDLTNGDIPADGSCTVTVDVVIEGLRCRANKHIII